MDKYTLDKINALTRRKFKAEELYTFPVVLCHNDIDRDVLRDKGKVTRYHRWNVSFGVADYYYDYEF